MTQDLQPSTAAEEMVLEYRASITEDRRQATAAAGEHVEDDSGKWLGIAVYSSIIVGAIANFWVVSLSLAFISIAVTLASVLTCRSHRGSRVKKWATATLITLCLLMILETTIVMIEISSKGMNSDATKIATAGTYVLYALALVSSGILICLDSGAPRASVPRSGDDNHDHHHHPRCHFDAHHIYPLFAIIFYSAGGIYYMIKLNSKPKTASPTTSPTPKYTFTPTYTSVGNPTTNPPVPVRTPWPVAPTRLPCTDTPNWVDVRGDGCDWYEKEEMCELYGDTEGENGLGSAIENCCHCSHRTHVGNTPTNPPDLIPTPSWSVGIVITSPFGNPPPNPPVPVNTPWPVEI
jgi:hypothetical protein